MNAPALSSFIDRQAEAFESALSEDANASLRSFLPSTAHHQYFELLTELIRIDIELAWRCGEPRRLNYYLTEYTLLREDRHSLERVAFEEYRQRRIAGEQVTPRDYVTFGIEPNLWPPIASESQKHD